MDGDPFLTILELNKTSFSLASFSSSKCRFSTSLRSFSNSCLLVFVLKNPNVARSSKHVKIVIFALIKDAKDMAWDKKDAQFARFS